MALPKTIIYVNVMTSKFKIQKRQRTKENTEKVVLHKNR